MTSRHRLHRVDAAVARLSRRVLPRNSLADRLVSAAPTSALPSIGPVIDLPVTPEEVSQWARATLPGLHSELIGKRPKKLLELFVSASLLRITPRDVYLDAAGGYFTYAGRIPAAQTLLSDIDIAPPLLADLPRGVDVLDAPADRIPLPDSSVDKISCHHSFEHFQQDADIGFIHEIQRLLAPAGRCVIVPLFVSDRHTLLSGAVTFSFGDEAGRRVRDPTATLPGGERSGNFARVYSPETLISRVLNSIDHSRFSAEIVELSHRGRPYPNREEVNPLGAAINAPYRALVVTSRHSDGGTP
jgi:SAM-dependent methyltransferase